jgi:uncharacterized membrane protein YbhN (UPF0104 family)
MTTASPPNRQTIIRVIGTIVALALLVYLLGEQGWEEIGAALRQIAAWRLLLALVLIVISRLAVWARWHVLLRSGGVAITPGQSLRVTFAGLFATNFLPTTIGGDVVRLAGAIQLKYDAAVCTASLIVDRLVGMAGMAMTVPFGLPSFLQAGASQGSLFPFQNTQIAGLAAFPYLGKWWRKAWEAVASLARRLLSALGLWLKQPRALLNALFCTWVHMLCLFGILWLLFGGMGETISAWLIAGLYSIVYFVTLLPFSINGYGLQEISMTFVFSRLGGTTMSSALTAALLFRTLLMAASLPGVAFVPGMLHGRKAG